MKITFLGTNGWYSTKTGNTICTLLESEEYYIVLDAGDGIWKLPGLIKKDKPIYIFLSHLHLDHIIGFHSIGLLGSAYQRELNILLPKGMKKPLLKIIDHPFAASLKNKSFPVKMTELSPGKHQKPFPLEIEKLFHVDPAYGIRIELDGKTIAYCLDTGVCKNTIKLAKKADVLIHECSNKSGITSGKWGHVNPEEAALIAKRAGAKKLLMTHFAAHQFTNLKDRKIAELNATKVFKDTISSKDGMVINI